MVSGRMTKIYDTIGVNYANLRKPDPRIAAVIEQALGSAETVLNVGAGTGSYEPADRKVTALEPSSEMISQRPHDAAPVVQGQAEDLPFEDKSFDAAMAILTIHHWTDKEKGLREMRRVNRGPVVLLTFDAAFKGFWLLDYFPKLVTLDEGQMPAMESYCNWMDDVEISPVPIPHDCIDGFVSAYWKRPAAYLDERIRAAMSPFWAIGDITAELERLQNDLDSGRWAEEQAALMDMDELDCGYRLVVGR